MKKQTNNNAKITAVHGPEPVYNEHKRITKWTVVVEYKSVTDEHTFYDLFGFGAKLAWRFRTNMLAHMNRQKGM